METGFHHARPIEKWYKLDVDELKEVIDYCEERIDELQRDEVESLEAEMWSIQDKLLSLKGKTSVQTSSLREGAKKQARPIVNPNDSNQVYTFGKRPEWLKALLEPANGDKNKELEMMEAMRAIARAPFSHSRCLPQEIT